MQRVPDGFSQRVIDVHGDAGADWLSRLADTIAECEQRWSIQAMPPFAALSLNYVAPVTRADGKEAVLKLGVPRQEFTAEIEALRVYEGRGMVKLLAGGPDLGAILLERLRPGALLSSIPDDAQATSIAVQVMKQIREPPPSDHRFPTVSIWASGLGLLRERFPGATGPIPGLLLDRAEALFSELIGSMSAQVLLHGDLHHENILSAQRESPGWRSTPKEWSAKQNTKLALSCATAFCSRQDPAGYWRGASINSPMSWDSTGSGSWGGRWPRRCFRHGGVSKIAVTFGMTQSPVPSCLRSFEESRQHFETVATAQRNFSNGE